MPEGKSQPVLIVDDDPVDSKHLQRHLDSAGYEVLVATNGDEAMRVLLARETPIIITDWVMPEMDGGELCHAIRSHEGIRYAYVIVLTAHSSEDRIVEAFEAGADDYLAKPFKSRELLARMRAGERIIELQRSLDARNREVHRFNAEQAIANAKLAEANEKLNRIATYDELTGLLNRREALNRLEAFWAGSDRRHQPLA